MSNTVNIWATASKPELTVRKDVPISRGTATYRAFHKLGVLDKTLSEYDASKMFDAAYDDFKQSTGEIGEMYIAIPLSEKFGLFELYFAFRESYAAFEELHPIWYKYEPDEFGIAQPGSDAEVHAMLRGDGDVDGLYYMSRIVEVQREESKKKFEEFHAAHPELKLRYFDPAAYIALTAIRIESGEKPVDFVSYTRFVGITAKEVNEKLFVPLARWSGDAMRFGWSGVGSIFGDCGVRYSFTKAGITGG